MSIPKNIKRFRPTILPCAIFMFGFGMMLGLGIIATRDGLHIQPQRLAYPSSVALLLSFLFSWILSVGFPVGFSADGIYGHSIWGMRRFVSWPGIKNARTFHFLIIKYLRVYAADGMVIWLPLFQSHPAEFRDEIRRFAPPNSPVLQFL